MLASGLTCKWFVRTTCIWKNGGAGTTQYKELLDALQPRHAENARNNGLSATTSFGHAPSDVATMTPHRRRGLSRTTSPVIGMPTLVQPKHHHGVLGFPLWVHERNLTAATAIAVPLTQVQTSTVFLEDLIGASATTVLRRCVKTHLDAVRTSTRLLLTHHGLTRTCPRLR